MNHQTILFSIFFATLLILFFYILKNRPDYLVLIGIRGLLSYFFIQFVRILCTWTQLPVLLFANPVTLSAGGLLGFPGILLLYAVRLYLYSF